MSTKICKDCKLSKRLDDFGLNNAFKDKKETRCKPCYKKYREKNKDRINATNRNWKKRNKKQIKEYDKKYQNKTKHIRKIKSAAYRELKKEYIKAKRREPSHKYRRLKESAQLRKLDLQITYEQYLDIIKTRECYYCDTDFSNETGSNLNRLDNSKGYTIDNVKPCCATCNYIMLDYTKEELKQRLYKIARRL